MARLHQLLYFIRKKMYRLHRFAHLWFHARLSPQDFLFEYLQFCYSCVCSREHTLLFFPDPFNIVIFIQISASKQKCPANKLYTNTVYFNAIWNARVSGRNEALSKSVGKMASAWIIVGPEENRSSRKRVSCLEYEPVDDKTALGLVS